MTTDTAQGLLRAILLEPADDTARLVYADYLEENGEPDRAEFVRVQVQLAVWPDLEPDADRLRYRPGPVRQVMRERLRRRERELYRCNLPDDQTDPAYLLWDWGRFTDPAQFGHYDGRAVLFRRGFVAEVRCPLAALFGGPCKWCRGSGGERDDWFPGETGGACRKCGGTGTALGCAAELFSSHPVERVTLTDRNPDSLMDGTAWGWLVAESDRPDNAFWLGPRFRPYLLTAGAKTVSYAGRHSDWVWFDTADAARDGLARAAVSLGRELAGLPPPSHSLV